MPIETFTPCEENLGQNCRWWFIGGIATKGCAFPKIEMQGRQSCEGIIDDVCLFLKDGRHPVSLSQSQVAEIKLRAPGLAANLTLPPGETI